MPDASNCDLVGDAVIVIICEGGFLELESAICFDVAISDSGSFVIVSERTTDV